MAKYKDYQAELKRRKRYKLYYQGAFIALLILIVLTSAALVYVVSRMFTGKALFDTNPFDTGITTIDTQPNNNETTNNDLSEDTDTTIPRYWNTLTPVSATVDNTMLQFDMRMYSLPENGRVSNDYFSTALFIGDSLTQGFGIYPPLKDIATVAGFKGIGPREIIQNNIGELQTGEKVAMWDYICAQAPLKIYVGIGTNALVAMSADDAFLKYYGDMLDMLRAQFPNIPIYVQSITQVSQATSDNRPLLSNDRIRGINAQLALMAYEKGMYFVNVNEVLANESGCLREDIAGSDGTHMRDKTGYEIWVDYLATHTAYNPLNLQYLTENYNA